MFWSKKDEEDKNSGSRADKDLEDHWGLDEDEKKKDEKKEDG